ncbi:MAG: phage protein Gp37 [Blastomonas sp.]
MIAAIENGVLDVLRQAGEADQLGYVYRTLETYPDEFDAYLKEKQMLRCPGAWCVFLAVSGMAESDDGIVYADARFALVVAAENLRNETATRHGGGGRPGSYQLAMDAAVLLSGHDLGLDIGRIALRRMGLIGRSDEMRKQKLSMMVIEFETRIALSGAAFLPEPGSFETFHANWDVPPFGGVGPELPDDDNADASDHVTLEGADI